MIPLSGIGVPSQNDGKVLIFYQNFRHLVCYNYRIAMSISTRGPIVVFFAVAPSLLAARNFVQRNFPFRIFAWGLRAG